MATVAERLADAEARNNLGIVFMRQNRVQDAISCFAEALRCNADYAEAHNNLGVAYQLEGKIQDAIVCYRQAARCNSWQAMDNLAGALLHYNLGNAFLEERKLDEAAASFEQSVRLNPNLAEAHHNLGFVLKMQGKVDRAVPCYERALALKPDYAEAHNNLGNVWRDQCKLDDALACYERALLLNPGFGKCRVNRALLWLWQGRFEKGWAEYEWRWEDKKFAAFSIPAPVWDGSSLRGKTILLRAEQGFGDALQFVRYASLVKQSGGTVLLECLEPLVRLLRTCPGVDRVVPPGLAASEFDVQAPLLSLPRILRTSLKTIPNQIPYLHADLALAEHWREKLAACGLRIADRNPQGPHFNPQSAIRNPQSNFRIGIAWQGDPKNWDLQYHDADLHRSIPLELFEALAQVPGVSLYSVQKGFGMEQLARLGNRFPVIELGSQLNDFMDTAAVMTNLDLVISADSSPVHLAGALGKPVWVALPFSSCWRWFTQRLDSPWYPTMRLFRQKEPGEWRDVFQSMARALREEVRR